MKEQNVLINMLAVAVIILSVLAIDSIIRIARLEKRMDKISSDVMWLSLTSHEHVER